jgi:signal transduction histidine kinase
MSVGQLHERVVIRPAETGGTTQEKLGVTLERRFGLKERIENSGPQMVKTVVTRAWDLASDRRTTAERLVRAQKMEAVGSLTAAVTHEFNNCLGVVIGNLDLLIASPKGDAVTLELAHDALDAALHGADLTRRLLAFAQREPLKMQRIEINILITDAMKRLRSPLQGNIEVSLDLENDVWPVDSDPDQFETAMTELATIAGDAMPKGGRLTITTANRRLDENHCALHPEIRPGEYVLIRLSDCRTGLPSEVPTQMFEPSFTTKEQGRGIGLGQSMVFDLIEHCGGHIGVDNEAGIGTLTHLYMPRSRLETGTRRPDTTKPGRLAKGETVLVVEDNAACARMVALQLRALNYRVLEADSVEMALHVLGHEEVDVLLSDIVMPGETNGIALARSTLARWPKIRVVLTSGLSEAALSDELGSGHDIRLLTKPYRRADLARAVQGTVVDA